MASQFPARLLEHGRGVRGRSAAFSALAVFVVLTLGALAMLALFRSQLTRSIDDALLQTARTRADLIDQGADPATLTNPGVDTSFIWIGTADGPTVALGGNYQPAEVFAIPADGTVDQVDLLVSERQPSFDDSSEEGEDGEHEELERQTMRLAASSTTVGLTVVSAAETESVDETLGRLAGLFAFAVPTMTLVVLGLSWLTVGRALRPVDEIRKEAAIIGGEGLSRRVPVPEAKDEIQRLALDMNNMLARLEAHDERLRQFTADASHELKSPVANLRVLLETQRVSDPAWGELRPRLEGELDRLRALVDNLLYLARHDEHQLHGAPGPATGSVALDDLLFAEAELLTATTDLRVDVSGIGPVIVDGSITDLQRMFRNLCDNAARHAATTVSLRCSEESGRATVDVADDGPGIAPADRERVFERFTRLDDARARDAGGTGLGLAIVKAVAENHGASVTVGASAGETGTRFTVTFSTKTG